MNEFLYDDIAIKRTLQHSLFAANTSLLHMSGYDTKDVSSVSSITRTITSLEPSLSGTSNGSDITSNGSSATLSAGVDTFGGSK